MPTPVDALRTLAPGGPPEAVTLLAMDLASPWGSSRTGVRDRPDHTPPLRSGPLLELLDALMPWTRDAGDGHRAWLRHYRLALPVAELKGPHWLLDLPPGTWVPLAPSGWPDPDDRAGVLTNDARLVAVHLLWACSAGDEQDRQQAARTLVEWCCGIRRASWSTTSGGECPALAVHWAYPGPSRWHQCVTSADVDAVTAALTGDRLIPADWAPPPPSAQEIAEQAERERIVAEGRARMRQWDAEPRPQQRPAPLGNDYVQAALRRTRAEP